MKGYELAAQGLQSSGISHLFFLVGGPMTDLVRICMDMGIRCIDVRHEQAAAMMAHGYARVSRKVGVCVAGSGPDVTNLVTGVACAFTDKVPMVILGGSTPVEGYERGSFQEIDQLAIMRPITKWATRVYDTQRIPEYIRMCLRRAVSGQPGPVYLDLPGDVIYADADPDRVAWPRSPFVRERLSADPQQVRAAADQLVASKRPIIIVGNGAYLAGAERELLALAESLGIPVYPMPQSRGMIPDDHPLSLAGARSQAFRTADTVLVLGAPIDYMVRHAEPPQFHPDAAVIHVEADPAEVGLSPRVTIPVAGDVAAVLNQLLGELAGRPERPRFDTGWLRELEARDREKNAEIDRYGAVDQEPIHPRRLCWELRRLLPRDAILAVDGQEILHYGRQIIPTFASGHRLNSGPLGCMGVGIPFAVGAKVASPESLVVALTGDGAFGFNCMELDTALRHKIPIVTVISNNGGWTANIPANRPGRNLGFTRYDEMFRPLGCHTANVTQPVGIGPALAAAIRSEKVSVVNVITDPQARAASGAFVTYNAGASV